MPGSWQQAVQAPQGTGPASPRPQAARKSREVRSTERSAFPIALSPITNTWAARLAFERVGASCCRGALPVRPAGYAQQLGRLDLQHGSELGDDFQARIGRAPPLPFQGSAVDRRRPPLGPINEM